MQNRGNDQKICRKKRCILNTIIKLYVNKLYTPVKKKDRSCQNEKKKVIYNYMLPSDVF